jgi:hypothetical protein
MDQSTAYHLELLGINPSTVPPGTVSLLSLDQLTSLGGDTASWASRPYNSPALAYEVETIKSRHVGLVLRNLYSDDRRSLKMDAPEQNLALWHNLTPSLPIVWSSGVALLVEGPKDARFLFSYGLPALAYLGSLPSPSHWDDLLLFCKAVMWLPDKDPFQLRVQKRRQESLLSAKLKGLIVWQVDLHAKDPAALVGNYDEIFALKSRYDELVTVVGGGYKCGQ